MSPFFVQLCNSTIASIAPGLRFQRLASTGPEGFSTIAMEKQMEQIVRVMILKAHIMIVLNFKFFYRH
jgi:hypothetical protein